MTIIIMLKDFGSPIYEEYIVEERVIKNDSHKPVFLDIVVNSCL